MGNGNVLERGCGSWVDPPEQGTCAVIYASSYVLVALISVNEYFLKFFGPMYASHLRFFLVGRLSLIRDMVFPRVSGLSLQLLWQLVQAASTELTCSLILLRTKICLGRVVITLFPAFRREPESGSFFRARFLVTIFVTLG